MSLFRFGLTAVVALSAPLVFAVEPRVPAAHDDPLVAVSALPPLTLHQAVSEALARNPGLAHFAFQLKAQTARIESAGFRPAPEFNSALEDVFGTGSASKLRRAQATFSLSQVIELGGQRDRRIDAARLGIDGIDIARKAAQLDVLAEVSRRFIHIASDQEQLQLTHLATGLAEKTVSEVNRRVKAAKSPEVELHRANISLSRARVEQEHAEHELLTSRRKLAAMWGERDADFGVVNVSLFELPQVGDLQALTTQLAGNPDFLRYATEARQREAEIRLAEAKARSSITLSAGVRRLEEIEKTAFVAGFSAPLFNGRRAQPAIDEARALRESIDAESWAARVKAEAQLFELVQELKHSITEAEMLRDDVLPQMEEALKETEYAYQRGRYSYLEWVDAQRERVTVQRALIEAAANAHLFQAEIERLTGAALPSESGHGSSARRKQDDSHDDE